MRSHTFSYLLVLAVLCLAPANMAMGGVVTYISGVSPQLTGVFELGTFLPNHIGGTNQDGAAAPITGQREYIYDVNGSLNPATALPFNLVVYSFSSAKDSVRLYPSQDHYGGGPIDNSIAPEVMEYSVWGSNTGGTLMSDWTMLVDPTGWTFPTAGLPVYTFAGSFSTAVIYRDGSFEGGIANAYVQDYTFAASYKYFGIRGSSIAMAAFTADPELDTMAAFDRADVPLPGGDSVPEPMSVGVWMIMGCLALARNRFRSEHIRDNAIAR